MGAAGRFVSWVRVFLQTLTSVEVNAYGYDGSNSLQGLIASVAVAIAEAEAAASGLSKVAKHKGCWAFGPS